MTPRPLAGKRVVVTRAAHQADELCTMLTQAGAEVVRFPTIAIADPEDGGASLANAAASLDQYEWVAFTSANAVERFAPLVHSWPVTGRVAAVGVATASALRSAGIAVHLVPDEHVSEALASVMPEPSIAGAKVLMPTAAVTRDVIPKLLRERGWTVDVVDAYRTVAAKASPIAAAKLARAEVITFTSSSTVIQFLELVKNPRLTAIVACIGPITAATAREHGFNVAVEAEPHTVQALVDGLELYFA